MSRVKNIKDDYGFFGIGILNNSDEINIGTLWRSAYILGASFIFTVDKKYKPQGSDVTKSWTRIPLYHYQTFEELKENLPFSTKLVAVEMGESATPLEEFEHPDRTVYLLGNEISGLPEQIVEQCHSMIKIPGEFSLNVAVTGSIVMYDRMTKISS
jgi:tRNA G18 (ribose-2'-O)-methylase SpoU